jgi:hypothetical protein
MIDELIGAINKTYPQYGCPTYGTVDELIVKVRDMLVDLEQVLVRCLKRVRKNSLVAFDWAGIGDTIHTRIILQHLVKDHKVDWITLPLVADLYKDDSLMNIISGIAIPYRDANQIWINSALIPIINEKFTKIIRGNGNKCVHVSKLIVDQYRAGGFSDYADLYFKAFKIKRDDNIKHHLRHLGKFKSVRDSVIIEPVSMTLGNIPHNAIVNMINNNQHLDFHIVGKDFQFNNLAIDSTNRSLYDTFSIMKGSKAFIGKSSGIQTLTCFLPHIPVHEVDVSNINSLRSCRYREVNTISIAQLSALKF